MDKRYLPGCLLLLFIVTPFFFSLQKVSADAKVVLNEFVVHPDSGGKEWVEFYNPGGEDLSNYWIDDDTSFTDDAGGSSKKGLTTIQSGKDPQHPYIELSSSMFNNAGDDVVLFDSNGTIVDQYHYSDDPGSEVAIGRSPDGNGSLQILASATKGDLNTTPQPTNTPTLPPQPTATHTPKPTQTPVLTKTPTPTKSSTVTTSKPSPTASASQTMSAAKKTATDVSGDGDLSLADLSGMPTSVLGVGTTAATVTIAPTKMQQKKNVPVKGSTTKGTQWQVVAITFIGSAVLLIACGILVFWKIRKSHV